MNCKIIDAEMPLRLLAHVCHIHLPNLTIFGILQRRSSCHEVFIYD